ncbi:hypothetical protein ACFWMP_12970 [Paenibacillus sp. NPDC058367]|uniref:hypothetical protein n=1 Tax=Paenibacillus sp. NPDC058367 TaxID=3346460 RepID=UPI00365002EF
MNYLGSLRLNQEGKQKQVEDILERNKAQPVGHRYIDIITDSRYIRNLVFELTQVGIAINGVTWWCHVQMRIGIFMDVLMEWEVPKAFISRAGLVKWV